MYLYDFANADDLVRQFQIDEEALRGVEVLLAYYSGYEEYCGDAYVLFKRDGKLWGVHGSHCSCHGLEGQWEPEVTSLMYLEHWLTKGRPGHAYINELREIVEGLKGQPLRTAA